MFFNRKLDLIESSSDQGKLFLYGLMIWTSIFVLINQKLNLKLLNKKQSDDTKNRIVSILHGLWAFWVSIYIVIYEQPRYSQANTELMNFLIITSISYFAYDFYACYYYHLMDYGLVLHHVMSISGYAVAIYCGYGGTSSITGLFYAEASNFPMHMRCILRNFGLKYTKLYELFEYSYFALYIIFRGLFTPIMAYHTLRDPMVPLGIKVCAFAIAAQSAYYIYEYLVVLDLCFIRMKRILSRLYRHFKERQQKNIHYDWLSLNPKINELSYTRIEKKESIF